MHIYIYMAVCKKSLLVRSLCPPAPSFGRGFRGTVSPLPSDPGGRTRGRTRIGPSGAHKGVHKVKILRDSWEHQILGALQKR